MQRTLSQADAEMVMKMSKDNAEHVFVKTREKQKEKLTRCLQEEKKSDGQGNEKRNGWVKNCRHMNLLRTSKPSWRRDLTLP